MKKFSGFHQAAAWIKQNLERTFQTLQLCWKIDPTTLILVFLLTTTSSALPIGIAYVGKMIIDAVVAKSVTLTAHLVLAELVLVGLQTVSARWVATARSLLGMKMVLEVNCLIVQKAASLSLGQMEDSEVHDQLDRAERDANTRPVQMLQDMFQILQNVLTLFGYIGLLYAFTPFAVVVLVVAALPATAIEMLFSNRRFHRFHRLSLERRRFYYFEHVLINLMYAKEIRALNLSGLFLGRHRDLGVKLYDEDRHLIVRRAVWATGLSFLTLAAFYGFYLVIAREAAQGLLTLGNLTLYLMALRQGQQAFQAALGSVGSMYEHNLYMSTLFQFLAIPAQTSLIPDRIVRSVGRSGLRFENVSFRYPGQENWALKSINLTIQSGESIALVGFNGAGKTTMIKLLCRLYEPTEGRIFLDDVDLKEWPIEETARRLSVVFQDFNRYNLTFGENVGIGDVEHLNEESKILAAIEKAGVSSISQSLPNGLATQMGKNFGGAELSGGQWQRTACARVFMKSSADILILDEPTSSLDPQGEYESLQLFRSLARDKTSILISHHFPMARIAERIVVMEDGRIVEDGTHESLLTDKGRYAHLFSLQAQGYA